MTRVMILNKAAFGAIACSVPLVTVGMIRAAEPPSRVAPSTAKAEAVAPPDPINVLNEASRTASRRAKEAALTRTGPVILVEGDKLVLNGANQRSETHFTPEVFHVLKSVSHIPL